MIKLYYSNVSCLNDSELFNKKYVSLPKFRREKVDKVRFMSDKILELGAGLLLMHSLQEYGVDSENIQIGKNSCGKPYIADRPDLCFNLSHSHEIVICAVSDNEIGCDIQFIEDKNTNYLNIAGRFFTAAEKHLLDEASLNTPEKLSSLFYDIWVLKESCIKASGLGLSMPLDSFESLPGTEKISLSYGEPVKNREFYLKAFNIDNSYKCAIAAVSNDFPEYPLCVNIR